MKASRTMIVGNDYLICHSILKANEKEILNKLRTSYALFDCDSNEDKITGIINGIERKTLKNTIFSTKELYNTLVEIKNPNPFDVLYKSYSTFLEKDIPINGESLEISKETEIINDTNHQKILVCYSGEYNCVSRDKEFRFHPLKVIRLNPGSLLKITPVITGIIGIFEKGNE